MASIEIKRVLTNSSIPTLFIANGTFTGNPGTITCSLMRGPMLVANGHVVPVSAGKWQATFAGLVAEAGLTLIARIADPPPDEDIQTNITVDPLLPLDIDEPVEPVDGPGDYETQKLSGKYRKDVVAITCTAFYFARKQIQGIAAVCIGELNTPAQGQWKGTLKYLPKKGRKLGVLATAFNKKGEILGHAFSRI